MQPHCGAQANAAAWSAIIEPGDTHPRPRARPRRPPDPRHEDQLLRQALRRRRLRGGSADVPHRHGQLSRASRARDPAEAHHRRLVRVPASARLRGVPQHRRRGRRPALGRHGALQRARRGRRCTPTRCRTRTSSPRPRHKTLAGPRARHDPRRRRGRREEVQLRGVPGPAGRARSCTSSRRRPSPSRSRRRRSSRSARSAPSAARRSSPSGCSPPDAAAAGVSVLTGGTDVHLVLVDLRNSAARRQAGRGPPARGRHHREPQRRAVRPAPADGHLAACGSALRRSPPAASATPSSPRSPTSSRRRCSPARTSRRCAPGSSAWPPTSRSTRGSRVVMSGADPRRQGDRGHRQGRAARRVAALATGGVVPGLGTVLVGDDPGSHAYVRGKHKDCAEVGIASIRRRPAGRRLAGAGRGGGGRAERGPRLHRLHRPAAAARRLDTDRVLELVDPAKDADGLHPTNLGRLVLNVNRPMSVTAAVHAARRGRPAAAARRRPARRRGRRRRPRRHRRPSARAAADPAVRQRHGHALPHRHEGPGRAHPPGRRRRRRRGRRRAS